jgi:hypothetical protein
VSVIHLKPPKRNVAPSWLKHPLRGIGRSFLPWPQAWAVVLLLLNAVLHLGRAIWHWVKLGTPSVAALLIGLFGVAFLLLSFWLLKPDKRALTYATGVTFLSLVLGGFSFVTSFDRTAGVSWLAVIMLLIDVLVIPLCAAGLTLPLGRLSGTRSK